MPYRQCMQGCLAVAGRTRAVQNNFNKDSGFLLYRLKWLSLFRKNNHKNEINHQ